LSAKKTFATSTVKEKLGNNIRVRACGLLYNENKLLLIRHKIDNYFLWAPPGGGVDFGESIESALIREFKEETRLDIRVEKFLFLTEYIKDPLHAIELFYLVSAESFEVELGMDPEFDSGQVLDDIKFVGSDELIGISMEERHLILKSCTNPIELLDKQGQIK